MIKRNVIRGVVVFIFFCVFAAPSYAADLVLPTSASIDGLTWDLPGLVTTGNISPSSHATLEISNSPELSVKIKVNSASVADMVISPSPTDTPTFTPTPTPAPENQISISLQEVTVSPTPTPAPTATPTQTSEPQLSTGGGLNANVLFNMVNSYRASNNLPSFQKNDQVCAVAASRAPQVGSEVASGTMHAGLKAMNLPYWNTENIISMNSDTAAFNWWINDPIHHDAIVGNFTYSCVACAGDSCAEEFTNFQPK